MFEVFQRSAKCATAAWRPRFYRAQRNFKNFADLLVGKLVKIAEQQDFPEMIGHPHHRTLHRGLQLLPLQAFIGNGRRGTDQIDKFSAFLAARADRRVQRAAGAARLRADQIARFIGRDCEQPGPEATLDIKAFGRLMDLKKGLLKNIFRRGTVTQEANQEMKEFTVISTDQIRKAGTVTLTIGGEQLLVARVQPSAGG